MGGACCYCAWWNKHKRLKEWRAKLCVLRELCLGKRRLACDWMRLRPYHWWDWLIWILGDGSNRQDRVEIENGQNETEGVMFIDFAQHAIWTAVNMLAVSSQEHTHTNTHTYVLKTQAHTRCMHVRTFAQIDNICKRLQVFFHGTVAHDKHHTHVQKHLVWSQSEIMLNMRYESDRFDRLTRFWLWFQIDFTVWEHVWGVYVHTLGLGDNFGSTAPPAVHHWGTGPSRAARALSPGTNTTWMIGEREESQFNLHELLKCVHPNPGQRRWRRKSLWGAEWRRPGWGEVRVSLKTHRRETDKLNNSQRSF